MARYQIRIRYGGRRYYLGAISSKEERMKFTKEIMSLLEKEKRDGHIVSSNGIILKSRYRIGDVVYYISATASGKTLWDCIDTVKNTETNKFRDFTRRQLHDLTRRNNNNKKVEDE